jgi:hypothetical protein
MTSKILTGGETPASGARRQIRVRWWSDELASKINGDEALVRVGRRKAARRMSTGWDRAVSLRLDRLTVVKELLDQELAAEVHQCRR